MQEAPESLPLPDLYLIDSRKLLAEVERIRGLVLAVPVSEASHSATQTVIDALWRLRSNMEEILKVQAAIHSSFTAKAETLNREEEQRRQSLRVGLRVLS